MGRVSRIPTVGRLGRAGAMRGVSAPLPESPRGPELLDPAPQWLQEWERRIGRERARTVQRLAERGVVGTLPEMCAYGWLESRGRLFEFQSPMMGGRILVGGAVADFIVFDLAPGGLMIWRVQGEYWHGGQEHRERDREQRARLLSAWYAGLPVVAVVDLWENDVYRRFPEVFLRAEAGVELR